MEQIKVNILEYIKNKKRGNPAIIPFMELYLMAKHKEKTYIGMHLIQKIKEMKAEGLLDDSYDGIFITPKGLEYLKNNME